MAGWALVLWPLLLSGLYAEVRPRWPQGEGSPGRWPPGWDRVLPPAQKPSPCRQQTHPETGTRS